jgi:hypothetical protein
VVERARAARWPSPVARPPARSPCQVAAVEAPRTLPWRGPRFVLAAGCLSLAGGRADWLVEVRGAQGSGGGAGALPVVSSSAQAARG